MARERFSSLRRPPQFEQFGDDEDDVEDEEPDDDQQTSLDDLAVQANRQDFDRTFLINSADESFATGDTPAIPRPWEGIPRVAITYNLNFVWDDEADEWVRDTGNSSGGRIGEARRVDANIPGAASDDGWDTSNAALTAVTFTETYDEPPLVFVRPPQGFADDGIVQAQNVTTTGFDLRVFRFSTTADDSPPFLVEYITVRA